MQPLLPDAQDLPAVLDLVARAAREYVEQVEGRPALSPRAEQAAATFDAGLPEHGQDTCQVLTGLLEQGLDATVTTTGPRCYHFVIGGVTPAALGADLLASVLDQPAYAWVSSPLGVKLEALSLDWLKELFRLPASWGGVMTTGATMANFVSLAAARQWWGERHGKDVSEVGLGLLPSMPVLTSGHVHASTIKCLAMLGLGRSAARQFSRDSRGRLDLDGLEAALRVLHGAPAVLVANAGEVNAGDFDPIPAMADLATKYGAWLHVDGAFGLFARLSPRAEHLVEGVERADSVTVDGHKWLNVPYDCGFSFVRDPGLMARAFRYHGDYLPEPEDPRPNYGTIGPESSRRARSLSVWATLRAHGRSGYRALVERHLDLAQYLAGLVDQAPELERLAEVPLNIVCFRFRPRDRSEQELDRLNERLGAALLEDGRFYCGTTSFQGHVAMRPALVNWRIQEQHLEEFVAVVRELAARL